MRCGEEMFGGIPCLVCVSECGVRFCFKLGIWGSVRKGEGIGRDLMGKGESMIDEELPCLEMEVAHGTARWARGELQVCWKWEPVSHYIESLLGHCFSFLYIEEVERSLSQGEHWSRPGGDMVAGALVFVGLTLIREKTVVLLFCGQGSCRRPLIIYPPMPLNFKMQGKMDFPCIFLVCNNLQIIFYQGVGHSLIW